MYGEIKEENTTTDFSPLPEGNYNVQLDDTGYDDGGSSIFIEAVFQVLEGDYKNRKLWKRFYVTESTLRKFLPWQASVLHIKEEIEAANCKSVEETAKAFLSATASIIGREYEVSVTQREYNGKTYNDLTVVGDKNTDIQPVKKEIINHAANIQPKALDDNSELPF